MEIMTAGSRRKYTVAIGRLGNLLRLASEALGISTAIGILVPMGIAAKNMLWSRKWSMA